jgi:DNA invertase Pin-like site-specific DNA recombinase
MKVAGYYRISVAREDMKAPELYSDEIRRYCSYKNLELGEVFADIDRSGFRGAPRRPALEELLARRHEFSAIIVPKLSRLGRSMNDLVRFFDLFDSEGIPLVFLDMNIDTATSQGRLLRHIMAAFAEFESDVKADYSRANQRRLAEQGRPVGPRAPYGYVKHGRTYAIDAGPAEIVRQIYRDYVDGRSLNSICNQLTQRGIRGSRGGRFTPPRVRRLLDNPAYIGYRRLGDEMFRGDWPPLVDRALWDEVLRTRRARRPRHPVSPGVPSYLLSGLVVCGGCGHRLHHRTGKGGTFYRCPNSTLDPASCSGGMVTAARAEGFVLDSLWAARNGLSGPALRHLEVMATGWDTADMPTKRDWVKRAVSDVVLVPRPPGNRHGRGLPAGRGMLIHWSPFWREFGHSDVTELIPGKGTATSKEKIDPTGLSWADYQRRLARLHRRRAHQQG